MRRSTRRALPVVVCTAALAALALAAAQSGTAARASAAECKSYAPKLGTPLCDGNATVNVAGKVKHYTGVLCIINKNSPVEVFKKQAFVLLMIFAPKDMQTGQAQIVTNGPRGSVSVKLKVKLKGPRRRAATFTSLRQPGTPHITGSFLCK